MSIDDRINYLAEKILNERISDLESQLNDIREELDNIRNSLKPPQREIPVRKSIK